MNDLKSFSTMGPDDNSWRNPGIRQNVVSKIEEAIQLSGMQIARNSSEMENHVFMKAKNRDDYMNMVAKLILHVREMAQQKNSQRAPEMSGPNQTQPLGNQQVQNQPQPTNQLPNQVQSTPQQGLPTDPINALQNLASQGTRNQMMSMTAPQIQQQVIGNPSIGGMQSQMQQGPIVSQSPQAQTATNLLQTLNQRPQLNMQNKIGGMGMVGNNQMMGNLGMGNPMNSQLQSQLAAPGMPPQMMSMQNSMQVPMSGANTMVGQMQCNQSVGGMGNQMPGQMVSGMGNNQMVNMNMLQHVASRKDSSGAMLGAGYSRAPPANTFLRQSPSPSAVSPAMAPGPSPVSMGVMGGQLASPMSMGGLGCGGVGSPSPSASHMHHGHHPQQQRGVGMGMVASPQSSLNTPCGGAGGTGGPGCSSPGGEEAAYREKVRQLSKYIEPLRRMIHRMVSEGENVEKLTKMKNLLDILSNPNKRMPLETLIKCEVVLEKLDFKRSEGFPLQGTSGKEQIFNPLLEVVNNCLQSPFANHTLKRTFGSTLDALNGPEIKNLPPPQKIAKQDEVESEIPDVLQGEIARLDSRFKVSLEPLQLLGSGGNIQLVAQLDEVGLPCVPSVRLRVPRDYPTRPPTLTRGRAPHQMTTLTTITSSQHSFLNALDKALDARVAKLPKTCSVSQLLDAWEMSVRQACAPNPSNYTPVPALGL